MFFLSEFIFTQSQYLSKKVIKFLSLDDISVVFILKDKIFNDSSLTPISVNKHFSKYMYNYIVLNTHYLILTTIFL